MVLRPTPAATWGRRGGSSQHPRRLPAARPDAMFPQPLSHSTVVGPDLWTSGRVTDRVLVLWPVVKPVPLRWESRVQDIGSPETSQLHVISHGESSPRDLHLNAKTQLHSTTSKLQFWTPYAKQLARQEHNTTH